jgi:hypothetical protein
MSEIVGKWARLGRRMAAYLKGLAVGTIDDR